MRPATYPGITESTRGTQRVHVIPCSCESCQNTVEVAITGKRKPPSVLHNIAKRRGWKVRSKRAEFTCPEHAQ